MADWLNSNSPSANLVSSTNDIAGMFAEEEKADENALNIEPKLKARPRLVALTDEVLIKLGRNSSLNQITVSAKLMLKHFVTETVVFPVRKFKSDLVSYGI